MDTTREMLTLAGFAGGFLTVGAVVGLTIYHFGLGWFLSFYTKPTVDHVVESAERHLTRRALRRHRRERRRLARRVMVDGEPLPRHLAP
jgi:hypothetical protein